MAYVVGSVSVEVVPDFRNAQNAITAWFKAQKDQIEVPVKPVFDRNSAAAVEREAAASGTRISNTQLAREEATQQKILARAIAAAEAQAYREQAIRDKAAVRELADRQKSLSRIVAAAEAAAYREQAIRERSNAQQIASEARAVDRAALHEIRAAERVAQARIRAAERANAEMIRDAARADRIRQQQEIAAAKSTSSAVSAALREIGRDQKAQIQIEIDQQKAIEEGRETGGLIARSIDHEIHQNAGLIAGAVAAALILGAPAALAAASALFVGVGAIATAQSERVKSAWAGAWSDISSGAQADAAVLVPVFERMAGAIAASFQRMRPLIRQAFEGVAPQIDTFTDSLTRAAEFALPGIVSAIQRSGPAISGLGDLLESIGRGTGDFFARVGQHAPAAGSAMTALGGTFEQLLPILAELLGQGAELAATVLPAVTSALSAVRVVLDNVGGILPTVLTGFLAFRQVQGISRWIGNMGVSLATAAAQGGVFAATQSRLAGTLTGVSRALGPVGVAVGALGLLYAESQRNIQDWTQALNAGGQAAVAARASMAEYDTVLGGLQTGFAGALFQGLGLSTAINAVADDTGKAIEANKRYLDGLTPIESAQRQLAIATEMRDDAMAKGNVSAAEMARLNGLVAAAANKLARAEDDLAMSTQGVTQAMVDQIDQSRAQVDSAFAYEEALNEVEDAQKGYNEVVAEFGADSEEARRAALELAIAYRKVGEEASNKAIDALPAAMDDSAKATLGAKAELEYYYSLLAAGVDLPDTLDQHIADLERTVGAADEAVIAQGGLIAALGEVGIAASAIPNSKSVRVEALTDEAITALEGLGFKVRELPDGGFEIIAATDEAMDNLGRVATALYEIDGTTATPTLDVDDKAAKAKTDGALAALREFAAQNPSPTLDVDGKPAQSKINATLQDLFNLGKSKATPVLDADDGLASKKVNGALAALRDYARQHPTPSLDADDGLATKKVNGALANLQRLGAARATPVLDADDGLATKKVNGALAALTRLGQQRAISILDANDGPVKSKIVNTMGALANLGKQRPTPVLDSNDLPVRSKVNGALAALANLGRQAPTPSLNAKDNASGVIQSVLRQLASVPASKSTTITVTTVNRVVNQIIGAGVPKSAFAASGGAIEAGMVLHKFDGGGAIAGRGGPLDDLIAALGPMGQPNFRLSNGEHVLDAHDVGLLGGQAGVYAFREMLNSGRLGSPPATANNIRRMVETGNDVRGAAPALPARNVNVYTYDNPRKILRAIRADEQQQAALAAPW